MVFLCSSNTGVTAVLCKPQGSPVVSVLSLIHHRVYQRFKGWSGGAMVLDKLPVPRRPTIWIIVGQGPVALAVGAGGVVWTFLLSSILSSSFSLSLGDGPI